MSSFFPRSTTAPRAAPPVAKGPGAKSRAVFWQGGCEAAQTINPRRHPYRRISLMSQLSDIFLEIYIWACTLETPNPVSRTAACGTAPPAALAEIDIAIPPPDLRYPRAHRAPRQLVALDEFDETSSLSAALISSSQRSSGVSFGPTARLIHNRDRRQPLSPISTSLPRPDPGDCCRPSRRPASDHRCATPAAGLTVAHRGSILGGTWARERRHSPPPGQ